MVQISKHIGILKCMAAFVIRLMIKVLWMFPIKNNRVFCCAYNGKQYSCSPKYITVYLKKHYGEKFEIICALKKTTDCSEKIVKPVKILSLSYFYYFCTAKIIIDNMGIPSYMPKRKEQYLINTWHGGGAYKCANLETNGASRWGLSLQSYKSKQTNLVLSSNEVFSKKIVRDISYGYSGEILSCGLPRNDIFFENHKFEIKRKVIEKLGIDQNKLIILYAPTFRGCFDPSSGAHSWIDTSINISKLCMSVKKRFNADSVVLFRAHYTMNEGNSSISSCIDVTSYPDMQELLCAADMLISDYSSSIWDFSLMKKPCFLYVPDLDYYINEDRGKGAYTSIEDWPGIIARTNQELQKAVLEFDEDSYRKKVEKHHKDLGSYETGTACEQVCKRIAEVCGVES